MPGTEARKKLERFIIVNEFPFVSFFSSYAYMYMYMLREDINNLAPNEFNTI